MGSSSSKGAGGFRVFRVVPEGPGEEAGLEVFFDYVVEVNGIVVESAQQSFATMIKVCSHFCVSSKYHQQGSEGKRVKLTVYNCRTHNLRGMPHTCVHLVYTCLRCSRNPACVGRARIAWSGSEVRLY